MNYKARLIQKENGDWQIISYVNRRIPGTILMGLNDAVHEVIDRVNGKLDWKQYYIRFTHNGKIYQQVDGKGNHCEGCCFLGKDLKNVGCTHPHYLDGTKGKCLGRIYKEEQL